jgi:pimeloyl-ACP methyl ester carboxylesterase
MWQMWATWVLAVLPSMVPEHATDPWLGAVALRPKAATRAPAQVSPPGGQEVADVPVDEHVVHLEGGRLAADTPAAAVDQLVTRAIDHGGNGIVIHFHGGLVSYARGIATAETLHREYLAADAYPVFFVWESGVTETIVNNLGSVAKEAFFKLAWKRLTDIVLRKFGQTDEQRAGGALPPVDDEAVQAAIDRALDEEDPADLRATEPAVAPVAELTPAEEFLLEQELFLDPELRAEIQRISNALLTPEEVEQDVAARSGTVRGSTETLMDPAALSTLVDRPDPAERGVLEVAAMIRKLVSIGAKVIKRFAAGRDHGFHATIVEEILRALYAANVGGILWGQMKRDTADAFGGDPDAHGGDAFLAALNDRIDPADPPRIVLVGHSAGAIFVSRFIARADDLLPPAVVFDVVLEAPAATFAVAAKTISEHEGRIDGFRMFSMDDERERADSLVPFLYPHSLLYFVSGVVEDEVDMPLLGMERFHDPDDFPAAAHPDLATVRSFLARSADRAVWAVTARDSPPGLRTEARKHGDFDDRDPATLGSVKHIIRTGFGVGV